MIQPWMLCEMLVSLSVIMSVIFDVNFVKSSDISLVVIMLKIERYIYGNSYFHDLDGSHIQYLYKLKFDKKNLRYLIYLYTISILEFTHIV